MNEPKEKQPGASPDDTQPQPFIVGESVCGGADVATESDDEAPYAPKKERAR